MKMKVMTALGAHASLLKFGDEKLPMQLSYVATHNRRELLIVCEDYEKRRVELQDKYSEKDKKTGETIIPVNKVEKFRNLLNSLQNEEVEIDLKDLPLDGLPADFSIEPNVLFYLECMISDPPPAKLKGVDSVA